MIENSKETVVLLLNWNGLDWLHKFLPGLIRNTSNVDIIVIDNGSTDSSLSYLQDLGFEPYLQENSNQLHYIALPSNRGFTGGYNEAIQMLGTYKYLALLNTDVEVSPDWLLPLIDLFHLHDDLGVVMPKIKSFHHKDNFEYAGAAGGMVDFLGYPFCRGRIFDHVEKDENQYDNSLQSIFWASGAAFVIRKDLFVQIGGFHTYFFAHMEEIDLCWRVQRAGYKIGYESKSTVYHVGGGTLSYQSPKKTFLNFRNSLYMLVLNSTSFPKMLMTVFFRLILDAAAGLLFLKKMEFRNIGAIIKAHWNFFSKIPFLLRERKRIKKEIQHFYNSDHSIHTIFPRSIVFDYYILGKKKYSELKNWTYEKK